MPMIRHFVLVVVIGIVFRWLWKSSANERARLEAGCTLFPPTRAIRILAVSCGVAFTLLFVFSWFAVKKNNELWVPYVFLGLVVLSMFMCPPVLSIGVDGIRSRSWLGREKMIRWEEVTRLSYNVGNKVFTVSGSHGGKISHVGFNAEPGLFRQEIQKRTRLPVMVTRPGTWKRETVEVPYQEVETKGT